MPHGAGQFEARRQAAVSLLTSTAQSGGPSTSRRTDPKVLDRYGRNAFGWSLLMARRLVEAGVRLVQVNLGNNETWDTHGNAFPHLKDKLLPPTDRAVSALLDDLHADGLLDSTLIVMAGEFGRTPRISTLPPGLQAARPGPLGPRADRSSWPGAASPAAGSSARRTGSADTPPQTRRPPRTSPRRSTARSASRPSPPGTTTLDRPHQVYHGDAIRGLA